MRNAFFQVIRSNRGTGIKFFPPLGGGEELNATEVLKYLEKEKIDIDDLGSLNQGLKKGKSEEVTVWLSAKSGYAIQEFMMVTSVKEEMFAVARFYPPSNDGKRMPKEEILRELGYIGVKYGIDEKMIDDFIANPNYCTNYVIARGKPVVQGKDARIEYCFHTDRKARPKRNEDGSVDFHQLNNISHIKEGDVLAKLIPADMGKSGMNIRGQEVKPRKVEQKRFQYGKNISVSEDGLSLISQVNGHAVLEGESVFVSNVFDVPGDVDNSTGDIQYEGNVLVHGTVKTGFRIEASGDVEVLGAVEGAVIKAGGQIILHHGMQGMKKGMLEAEGNIIARFIESATVTTSGFVEVDSIIQSQVSAKEEIVVNGSKGFIIGGVVRSFSTVSAKTIGSPMGISTVVSAGTDPALKDRAKEITEQLKKETEQLKQIAALVDMYQKKQKAGKLSKDNIPLYIKAVENLKALKEQNVNLNSELEELNRQMDENKNACIKVLQDIFPGVRIIISEEQMLVNQVLSHCRFVKEEGTIRMALL